MAQPDVIDGDARRERIPVAGDPAGQRQAASAGFFGVGFPDGRVAFGRLRESGVGFGDLLLRGADLFLVSSRGIEFETRVSPDRGSPPTVKYWRGPRRGVRVEGEFAKISVRIRKNTQTEDR